MRFVTGNESKFIEAQKVFPNLLRLDLDLTEVQELDPRKVIEAKLEQALAHYPEELIVEDISVEVSGLGGLPGTLIKWFLKAMTLEQIAKLVADSGDSRAVARLVLGYASPGKEPIFIEETMLGRIVSPRGDRGFGWDPIFQMDGQTKTQAERKSEGIISFREQAFAKLKEQLN